MKKTLLLCSVIVLSSIVNIKAMDDGDFDGFSKESNPELVAETKKAISQLRSSLQERLPQIKEDVTAKAQDGMQALRKWISGEATPAEAAMQPVETVSSSSSAVLDQLSPAPVVVESTTTFNEPTSSTMISQNTLLKSGIALVAIAGLIYVLHKKGILKKIKQKIAEYPRVAAGVSAGLAAVGAGSYYYYAH